MEVSLVKFQIQEKSQRYDANNLNQLKKQFENTDPLNISEISLSGNSYSFEACEWIASNILKLGLNLKVADFSDMFVSRKKNEIP